MREVLIQWGLLLDICTSKLLIFSIEPFLIQWNLNPYNIFFRAIPGQTWQQWCADGMNLSHKNRIWNIWVRSRNCGCLVTWFCYQFSDLNHIMRLGILPCCQYGPREPNIIIKAYDAIFWLQISICNLYSSSEDPYIRLVYVHILKRLAPDQFILTAKFYEVAQACKVRNIPCKPGRSMYCSCQGLHC